MYTTNSTAQVTERETRTVIKEEGPLLVRISAGPTQAVTAGPVLKTASTRWPSGTRTRQLGQLVTRRHRIVLCLLLQGGVTQAPGPPQPAIFVAVFLEAGTLQIG